MAKRRIEAEVGSGNVFRDLGLKNPDELLAKAQLAGQIIDVIEARQLTRAAAGKLLGIDRTKVSLIFRGRLGEFSIDTLMRFLIKLGCDLRIIVESKARRRSGRMIVEVS